MPSAPAHLPIFEYYWLLASLLVAYDHQAEPWCRTVKGFCAIHASAYKEWNWRPLSS